MESKGGSEMKRGDQIAYIPNHAKEEGLTHPDTEYGFVYSVSPIDSETIFCRYWLKGKLGTLRTVSCSEATDIKDLVLHQSIDQDYVEKTIDKINKGEF